MKITKVGFKDFHQFKNIEIDLTYPKGHKKEGEPLEKVCLIGQSGTGKTTLLKIIGGHTFTVGKLIEEYDSKKICENVYLCAKEKNLEVSITIDINPKNQLQWYKWDSITEDGEKRDSLETYKKYEKYLNEIKNQFIYFPAELKYDTYQKETANLSSKNVIDFGDYNLGDVWNIVLNKIQEYQEAELKIRQQVSKIVEDNSKDIEAIQRAVRKLERWRKKVFNPLAALADECLDPLLKNFNLRVKRELDIQKKEDLGFIKIEDLKGNPIPQSLLSTGTKQVIFSACHCIF